MPKRISVGNNGSLFYYEQQELEALKVRKENERLKEQNELIVKQNEEILKKLDALLKEKGN